jgi:hypothetical protein
MTQSDLSGATWWRARQAKYPNSRDVSDLDPGFGADVGRFLACLTRAGARVTVSSTRRSAARAHLMHYSWKVSRGDIAAVDVPEFRGVQIVWDHGEEDASRGAARDMVDLFGMVHLASLRSNHIRGLAIDMNFQWDGELALELPDGRQAFVEDGPRTGQNRSLHRIGEDAFSVRKLLSDPPHWSANGR